jgi:hypothetical protein
MDRKVIAFIILSSIAAATASGTLMGIALHGLSGEEYFPKTPRW